MGGIYLNENKTVSNVCSKLFNNYYFSDIIFKIFWLVFGQFLAHRYTIFEILEYFVLIYVAYKFLFLSKKVKKLIRYNCTTSS